MNEWNTSEQQSSSASDPGGSPSRLIRRRAIVKGAAWSLPVLAAAVAVPVATASTVPACATQKTFFTLPDSPSAAGITTVFVVPAKVTSLTVTVAGGAGGLTGGSGGLIRGGNGGLVTATIPVVPGETLDLVVGQGGASRTALTGNPSIVSGGQGFGNGGDSDPAADNADSNPGTWWGGAAGGAGSAISRGGQPLVVAGGGGGAAGIWGVGYYYVSGGSGGDADSPGEANWHTPGSGGRMDIPGGLVGGAAVGPGTATPSNAFSLFPGLATTSARDGAVGGGVSVINAGTRYGSGAGAGGGGFAGGGSGARGASASGAALGAGGAGGTSYLDTASGVIGTTSTWNQSTSTTSRQGGTITIEWCA